MTALAKTESFVNRLTVVQLDAARTPPALSDKTSLKRLEAGETLYVEGDKAAQCYQVIDGVIKEYNTLEDGRRQVADFYTAGALFGISQTPRQLHTADAVSASTIRCYPRDAYLTAISESPELSQQFVETLMVRLHRARERMIMLGRMSATQRVAAFLLRLSSEHGKTSDITFLMSRQDMADHLGLTIETVCRVLTILRNDELISTTPSRSFSILNLPGLEKMTNGLEPLN